MEDKVIINDLHAEFVKGACTILTGPGGSGKTTLFETIVNNTHTPFTVNGVITVNTTRIRYMNQAFNFQRDETPREFFEQDNIAYLEEVSRCWRNQSALCEELKKLECSPIQTIAKKFIRIIYLTKLLADDNYDLLILDEPEVYADENLTHLIDKIKDLKKRKSVVVSTHHVAFAEEIGDYFLLLIHGKPIEFCDKINFFSSNIPEVQYLTKMGC